MLRSRLCLAALSLLAACAPENDAPPLRVRALVLSSGGTYVPQEVTLKTVSDPVTLEGQAARFVGGANLKVDPNDPLLAAAQTEAALNQAILKNEGRDVRVSYLEQNGVLWPMDFHSWNLVSTAYSLEAAFEYFRTVGNLPVDALGTLTVYYFPSFVWKAYGNGELKDNALFFSPVHAMLVLPFVSLQSAPLAINSGVLAHEYSHWIFNRRVYGGRGLPSALSQWGLSTSTPGINILKSLDEGLADFHAWGVSCKSAFGCNPRFLASSFGTQTTADRDLSKTDRCMDANLRTQLETSSFDTFGQAGLEYRVGSILASALYQAAEATGKREVLQRAVVESYTDSNTSNPGLAEVMTQSIGNQTLFSLSTVAGVIVKHISDPELKLAVCNEFLDHLQIPPAQLRVTGLCPDTAAGGITCPDINQP